MPPLINGHEHRSKPPCSLQACRETRLQSGAPNQHVAQQTLISLRLTNRPGTNGAQSGAAGRRRAMLPAAPAPTAPPGLGAPVPVPAEKLSQELPLLQQA